MKRDRQAELVELITDLLKQEITNQYCWYKEHGMGDFASGMRVDIERIVKILVLAITEDE